MVNMYMTSPVVIMYVYHHTILDNFAPGDKNQICQTFMIETSIFFSLIQVMLLKQSMFSKYSYFPQELSKRRPQT